MVSCNFSNLEMFCVNEGFSGFWLKIVFLYVMDVSLSLSLF